MKYDEFLELLLEADKEPEETDKEDKETSDKEEAEDKDNKEEENTEDDSEEKFEPEDKEEESEQDKLQAEIDKKFEEMGNVVMKNIKTLLDTKPEVIIQKFQKLGQDEAIREYLEQKFVPELKDQKDKLFITLNLDDFVTYISQKVSVEYLKKDTDKNEEGK